MAQVDTSLSAPFFSLLSPNKLKVIPIPNSKLSPTAFTPEQSTLNFKPLNSGSVSEGGIVGLGVAATADFLVLLTDPLAVETTFTPSLFLTILPLALDTSATFSTLTEPEVVETVPVPSFF